MDGHMMMMAIGAAISWAQFIKARSLHGYWHVWIREDCYFLRGLLNHVDVFRRRRHVMTWKEQVDEGCVRVWLRREDVYVGCAQIERVNRSGDFISFWCVINRFFLISQAVVQLNVDILCLPFDYYVLFLLSDFWQMLHWWGLWVEIPFCIPFTGFLFGDSVFSSLLCVNFVF